MTTSNGNRRSTRSYEPSDEILPFIAGTFPVLHLQAHEDLDPMDASRLLRSTVGAVLHSLVGQMAAGLAVDSATGDPSVSDGVSFSSWLSNALVRSTGSQRGTDAATFSPLHADLMDFVRRGGVMHGPWGHVEGQADGPLEIVPRSEAEEYFASLDRGRA